jgi:hypothetical protein
MADALLRFLLAMIAAYAAALAFHPVMRATQSRMARRAAWLLCCLAIALTPCLVPLSLKPLRTFAAIFATATIAKLCDVYASGTDMSWWRYAGYLLNWFWMLNQRPPPARCRRDDVRRAVVRLIALLPMLLVTCAVFRIDWTRYPFALEHVAKVTAVIAPVVLFVNAAAAVYRIVGIPALDGFNNPFAAVTPADFWRRWNRPTRQLFDEYVFRPAGDMRRPILATMLSFAVSGVAHEYIFAIGSGQLRGWQILYFLVQGCASAATLRVRPTGVRAGIWWAATIAFNLAVAAFFFQSVNMVLPFYARRGG